LRQTWLGTNCSAGDSRVLLAIDYIPEYEPRQCDHKLPKLSVFCGQCRYIGVVAITGRLWRAAKTVAATTLGLSVSHSCPRNHHQWVQDYAIRHPTSIVVSPLQAHYSNPEICRIFRPYARVAPKGVQLGQVTLGQAPAREERLGVNSEGYGKSGKTYLDFESRKNHGRRRRAWRLPRTREKQPTAKRGPDGSGSVYWAVSSGEFASGAFRLT
jgi:hypothetical protein